MIRVLIAGPNNFSGDGVTQHTVNLVNQLSQRDVKVIWYEFCGSNFHKIYQRTVGLLIECVKKQKEYNIIHVQCSAGIGSFSAALTGAVLAFILNKKFIFTYHNPKIQNKILFKLCLKQADKLVLISQLQRELINQNYPKYLSKTVIVSNGYNKHFFYPQNQQSCKKRVKLPADTKIILTVGNLFEVKGHCHFINAMGKIISTKKNIIGVIVGSGPLKQKLHNQIQQLNLEKKIFLIGGNLIKRYLSG